MEPQAVLKAKFKVGDILFRTNPFNSHEYYSFIKIVSISNGYYTYSVPKYMPLIRDPFFYIEDNYVEATPAAKVLYGKT